MHQATWRSAPKTFPRHLRAVDEDTVPCLNVRFVAQTLQCGQPGDIESGGLLERQRRRLRRQLVCSGRRVLGETAIAPSEDLLPGLEPGDLLPDCHHPA